MVTVELDGHLGDEKLGYRKSQQSFRATHLNLVWTVVINCCPTSFLYYGLLELKNHFFLLFSSPFPPFLFIAYSLVDYVIRLLALERCSLSCIDNPLWTEAMNIQLQLQFSLSCFWCFHVEQNHECPVKIAIFSLFCCLFHFPLF